MLVGARFGVVMHGYTGSAAVTNGRAFSLPIQLELRGTYVFGKNALAHSGFSPMIFVDAGVGKFDGEADVSVTQDGDPRTAPEAGVADGRTGLRRPRRRCALPIFAADRVPRGVEARACLRRQRPVHDRGAGDRASVRVLGWGLEKRLGSRQRKSGLLATARYQLRGPRLRRAPSRSSNERFSSALAAYVRAIQRGRHSEESPHRRPLEPKFRYAPEKRRRE